LADRFNTDPLAVLEWPEEMVRDALQIMAAQSRYHERTKPRG